MNLREVTIGRAKDCDIYLDSRCKYASGHHGTIYYDGNQLMYRDTSSNGTLINNINVKHRAVPIHRGDTIMLAGQYPVNWNQIDSYFPYSPQPQREMGTVLNDAVLPPQDSVPVEVIAKWNWGAFGLYPIWGFFNGCWWAFLVGLFFGFWFYPIPNIIFGIYGGRWAWSNKSWISVHDFVQTQSSWAIWGIIISCLNLVAVLICFSLYATAFAILL